MTDGIAKIMVQSTSESHSFPLTADGWQKLMVFAEQNIDRLDHGCFVASEYYMSGWSKPRNLHLAIVHAIKVAQKRLCLGEDAANIYYQIPQTLARSEKSPIDFVQLVYWAVSDIKAERAERAY